MRDRLRQIMIIMRSLARRPGYAATAIMTLAIGIGATTAIYSILQGSILRPLPYPEPERLLRVRDTYVPTGGSGSLSIPNFLDLRGEATSFDELAAYVAGSANLATSDEPVRVRALQVTTNFLSALGVGPAFGRGFAEGEDRYGAMKVVIITDRLFEDAFARRADVLGQTLRVHAEPYTVVGVLPASFWFPGDPQLIVPFSWNERQLTENRGSRNLGAFGRVRNAVTATAADVELKAIFSRLAAEYPGSNENWSITTINVRDWMLGLDRRSLWLLAGAVVLVLLIGCVNVANLMLVRAERRKREFAVLAAIGAGRRKLASDFVIESLVLTLSGTLIGMVVAWGATALLVAWFGDALPRGELVRVGWDGFAFAAGVAVLAALGISLVPAHRIDIRRLYTSLRESGGAMATSRLQQVLIAGEVALAVVLVLGASLLLNSFWRLNRVDTGIDPSRSLTFQVTLPEAAYESPEKVAQLFERAVERVSAVSGVVAAGITDRIPLHGGMNITTLESLDDPGMKAQFVEIRRVTPGFFAAAGIPLLEGRLINEADARLRADVVMISDEVARAVFPNGDAVGKRIDPHHNEDGYEVVGIVGSVREFGLTRDKRPALYWPYPVPNANPEMVFVVRTDADDPLTVMPAIRAAFRELDPSLPLYEIATMQDMALRTVGNQRLATSLFGAFGLIALTLAALGIFSVLAFAVEQRSREVAIRMALGATSRRVTRMIVAQGLRLTALGLVAGIVVALLASRLLSALLWEIEPTDPQTFIAVAVVAVATTVAAAYLPARRAARIEPAQIVRDTAA